MCYQQLIAIHHDAALTNPCDHSSPFVAPSAAPRRYDITGIGINLWLIHLHFIPAELETSTATLSRAFPAQTSSNHRSFLSSLCPRGPPRSSFLHRDGSQIRSPRPPILIHQPLPNYLPVFNHPYRDSNSGLIEGFVR